ncbi:conserved hypothetical protein [Ricinus communis]|uniref:Plant/T31B5-30 protein n=1 Tax=Ricinus communis TaxID=3988 RepID=B9SZW9_RICCO|nr:conserved hypothetical protein [Ricinus communis]|eukprot:XP_002531538.1 uncharacterized protein LOC8258359 isoform X1 [Ricinus communis]
MINYSHLLGPPAVVGKPPVDPLETTVDDPLVSQTANLDLNSKPQMGLTENLSPTFLSTGNPCLDFFFNIVPDTPFDQLIQRLQLAWDHDALITLKLICNLRAVRGTGKSDKEGFYAAALWLHKHHPETLALNLKAFADFGYFKDFLEILYRILEGIEVRKLEKQEWISRKRGKKQKKRISKKGRFNQENQETVQQTVNQENQETVQQTEGGEEKNKKEKESARVLRKEREFAKAAKALNKYKSDANYRFLFDAIADLFADLLKSDIEALKSKQHHKISLAAKWCPSIDSSFDKATLIYEAIARRVFPRESYKEYQEVEESRYAFRVRDRLRKEVLVPLHKILELPEVYMSAKKWNSLPYNRVPSVAMKTYKALFLKHDEERFEEYLDNVKSGKAKIAAGALLPHEIIGALKDENGGKVAELQWARMVDDMSKKGKLNNCIAVCDVSGSMEGIPMEVSVALGLLVSELSEEPWKGKAFTFSEIPELHFIEGDSLFEKTEFVRRMDWGRNTDFQKVFDRILEVAVENKLSEDQLIKRVFVFSDMEFDSASGNYGDICGNWNSNREPGSEEEDKKMHPSGWETDYQAIQRKFKEKGYTKVPEIVFWNLRNSSSTPVVAKQSGVALVSGFSKNLLILFLEEGGIVNPEDIMTLAIAGEEYKKLVVYD